MSAVEGSAEEKASAVDAVDAVATASAASVDVVVRKGHRDLRDPT